MALTTNFLIPIAKGVFTFGFIALFVFGFYKIIMINVFTKKRRLWIKFHVFKRPYPEDEVEWCMSALEKGWKDPSQIRKFLLTKSNFSVKKVDQILFIFTELKKKKGGVKDDRIRQSSGETEFPKINENEEESKKERSS